MSAKQPRRLLALLLTPLIMWAAPASAQTKAESNEILERRVEEFNLPAPGKPAAAVFDGIASSYNLPISVDPAITGSVTFRVYNTRLRGVLDAVCQPQGWHYEIRGSDGSACLAIMRYVTRSYSVDYPQVAQTLNSSASVSLSGSNSNSGSGGTNGNGTNSGVSTSSSNGNGLQNSNSSGTSTVSLSSSAQINFWDLFEQHARTYVTGDEKLIVNRFAGIVQLTGSLSTHALLEDYINRVMSRVRRHATITVRLIRIENTNSKALGVDMALAKAKIGSDLHIGGDYTGTKIGGAAAATASGTGSVTGAGAGDFGSIGNIALGNPTTQAIIGAGKLSALVTALSEVGKVTVADTATASALNNQMSLIQVTRDLPFFSKSSATTYNVSSTTTTNPYSTTNYSKETVSFGNVLEVTPQISDDLVSTVVVAPSVTEYLGQVEAPDGSGTAPDTGTRRYRSTYVLRNHESAIIGAFTESTQGKSSKGVPGLSKIPLIGAAFRTDTSLRNRSEFLILMTVDAEDGAVTRPRDVEIPLADQARRALGANMSKEAADAVADVERSAPRLAPAPTEPLAPVSAPAAESKAVQLISTDGK